MLCTAAASCSVRMLVQRLVLVLTERFERGPLEVGTDPIHPPVLAFLLLLLFLLLVLLFGLLAFPLDRGLRNRDVESG